MYHTTIVNPKTNRENKVRVFPIKSTEALGIIKKDGIKGLSWNLLDQPESYEDMASEMSGDSSRNNFSLSVFENALDYCLGLTVYQYLKAYVKAFPGKQPKIVRVAVNRNGDVFVLSSDHKVIFS